VRSTLFAVAAGAAAVAVLALLTVGCGGVDASQLPLTNDFADCDGLFTMNDEVATVDCRSGGLRVLVSQPERSPMHIVPLRFDARPARLVVSANARGVLAGGVWGVGCLASEPGDQGRGYALVIGADGEAAILRIDLVPAAEGEEGRFPAQLEALVEHGSGFVPKPSGPHVLRIECARKGAGAVEVNGSIDGGRLLKATDARGIAPFTGAFPLVITDRPGTDVRFDDVRADEE
jgi:hypothetical protein